ncbi:outer membrane protein [Thermodesulfobacteriota bacterium]
MKRIIIISCCIMITLFCSQTYGAEGRYTSLNLGAAIPGNSDIFDENDPETRLAAKFKKGMFASIALGKEYEYFRFEGEFFYHANDFESASIAGIDAAVSGEISALALLLNGYFDYKTNSDFTPYLYAGLGASMVSLSGLGVPDAGFGRVSDEDLVAAYQFGCGLTYRMNKNISLDLKYRYFVPSDPDFNTIQTEFDSQNISLGLRIYF